MYVPSPGKHPTDALGNHTNSSLNRNSKAWNSISDLGLQHLYRVSTILREKRGTAWRRNRRRFLIALSFGFHPRVSIRKKFFSLLSGYGIARTLFSKGRILSPYSTFVLRASTLETRRPLPSSLAPSALSSSSSRIPAPPIPPYSFFFIIGQRSTSKWFFGALRFHDDGTEQCAGLIPTACSFVRNRGKGKIAASPPGDPLCFAERVGRLDDNWRICEIMHDDEAAFLFVEMPPLMNFATNKIN